MIRLINLSSIKPNPNAGRTVYPVPGRSTTRLTPEGIVVERPVTFLRSMTPEPGYFFEYEPLQVTCGSCGAKFSAEELEDDWEDWGDDSFHYEYGCPKCHTPDCCEKFTLETIEEALKRKAHEGQGMSGPSRGR